MILSLLFLFSLVAAADTESSAPIRVKAQELSVLVPKGWSYALAPSPSLSIAGKSGSFITATPQPDIAHSEVHFGLRVVGGNLDLDHIYASRAPASDSRLTRVRWQGREWKLMEYTGTNSEGRDERRFLATTFYDGKRFLLVAGLPVTASPKFEKSLREMMESIRLGN